MPIMLSNTENNGDGGDSVSSLKMLTMSSRTNSSISCLSFPHNSSVASSFLNRAGDGGETFSRTAQPCVANHDGNPHSKESSSQLIMPNLQVPQRRPFSNVGRSMGKLTVLVTGAHGIGKSSLIRSITEQCPHIVHIHTPQRQSDNDAVVEWHASTRPYPWWQLDYSDNKTSKSRLAAAKAEEILDRNITFLHCDPPDTNGLIAPAMDNVLSRLQKLLWNPIQDKELFSLLDSGFGEVVDIVLYLLPQSGPSSLDLEQMSKLQNVTNLVPILARVDEIVDISVTECGAAIAANLRESNIQPFNMRGDGSNSHSNNILTISNILQSSTTLTEPSALTDSDYTQLLPATDLSLIISKMFSIEGAAQLRHSTAMKIINWRRAMAEDKLWRSALTYRSNPLTVSTIHYPDYNRRLFYNRNKLSSWAENLRHSLKIQRANFNTSTQMLECVAKKDAIKESKKIGRQDGNPRREGLKKPWSNYHQQDPLGLIEYVNHIWKHGYFLVEFLGGAGLFGCVAFFIREQTRSPA